MVIWYIYYVPTASFQILPYSSSIYHPTIRGYILLLPTASQNEPKNMVQNPRDIFLSGIPTQKFAFLSPN
jgi:hypothetical protein